MKYAAAYIRVSDDRQDEYSPDSQLKLIQEYAARNGYTVPEEYVFYDDGISGRSVKKRKAFNEMIAFAKSKEHPFDAILVWKFSRFARNQEESIVYKSMLRKIHVSVISVSETIDDSPFAPLIERIIEFMDEYYSTRLSQEVTRGMTEKASRGEAMCKGAFGYSLEGKTYIPNQDAAIVQYIYSAYLSGKGLRKIAMELAARGVKTYRGNAPDSRFVEYILRNPVYTGKIRWSPDGRASCSRYLGDNTNVMITDGKHAPIIDTDTFNTVQNRIMENKKKYGKYQRSEQAASFMLKGLVRCSSCGATLVHLSKKEPAVQCHNYAKGACKVSHYLSIKKANAKIIDALEQSVKDLTFTLIPQAAVPADFADYDLLIKREKEKLRRASEAYDAGLDTLEEYGRKKRAYQNEIKALQAEKENAKAEESGTMVSGLVSGVITFMDWIQSPNISENAKNAALRNIIDQIIYEKEAQCLTIYFYV